MNFIREFRQLLNEWFPDKASYAWFVFAVVIGSVYWLATVTEEKEVKAFTTAIKFVGVPEGFSVVGPDSHSKVNIEIAAPNEALKKLTQDDIKVEIDASGFTEGPFVYEITSGDIDLPTSASFVSVFPKMVQLQLDKNVTSKIALKPKFSGRLKGGKQIISWKVEPPAVEVTGPESVIANTKHIPTQPVLLGERDGDFEIPVVPIIDDPELAIKENPGSCTLLVSVGVKKITRSVDGVKIRVSRLMPNFEAVLNPQETAVTVEGESGRVEKISPEDILAQIDVGGLKVSDTPYRLKPVVEVLGENGKYCQALTSSAPEIDVLLKDKGSN